MKKVLSFDIDGTLAESRQPISQDMAETLAKLLLNNELVFLTGGSIELIKTQVIERLLLHLNHINADCNLLKKLHFFPTSGAGYYKFLDEKLVNVYNNTLSEEDLYDIQTIIDFIISEFKVIPITDYENMIDNRGTQVNFSFTGRDAHLEDKKLFDPDMSFRKKVVNAVKKSGLLINKNIELYIGGTTSIDFMITGVNKGSALKKWMENNNYSYNNILFFGDRLEKDGNDNSVVDVCKTISVKNPNETLNFIKKLI